MDSQTCLLALRCGRTSCQISSLLGTCIIISLSTPLRPFGGCSLSSNEMQPLGDCLAVVPAAAACCVCWIGASCKLISQICHLFKPLVRLRRDLSVGGPHRSYTGFCNPPCVLWFSQFYLAQLPAHDAFWQVPVHRALLRRDNCLKDARAALQQQHFVGLLVSCLERPFR